MEAGLIKWGDGKAALDLIKEIRKGTPLGRIVGCGAAAVGRIYGQTRVPVVKGQAIPAYDPRAVKGVGLTYATTPMGADHTSGYAVATNILKCGGFVDPLKKEGNVELSRNLQIATAAIDSTGMPLRGGFAVTCAGTVLFVLAYQAVGLLFIGFLGNFRLSVSLAAVYAAPAFAFTGITFPILGMPPMRRPSIRSPKECRSHWTKKECIFNFPWLPIPIFLA